jgi:SAM-dependent methyltransferase
MRCLFCDSSKLGLLYDHVHDRLGVDTRRHRFLECLECRSAALDAPPSAEALATFYPAHYTFKRAGGRSVVARALAALEWRVFYSPTYRRRVAVFRRLTGLRQGRLLEIGCGSGLLLAHFRESGFDVEGVELSSTDVAHAREHLKLTVLHGTVESLPLERDAYDAVVMINVLEHVLQPAPLLRRVLDVLRPGGWVALGVPVIDSAYARLLGARWGAVTEAPRHVSIPSFAGMVDLLRRLGFEAVSSAPAPLIERAAAIVLSLLPAAAVTRSYGAAGPIGTVLRRSVAATMMVPALLLALLEPLWQRPRRTETMLFCARKPGGGGFRVP